MCHKYYSFYCFKLFIKVELVYNIILLSGVRHSDSIFMCLMTGPSQQIYYSLSLCKVIGILLAVFPVRYSTSQWLINFITGSLYLLLPVAFFTHSPPPSHLAPFFWSLSVNLLLFYFTCSFVQLFLDPTYK